MCIRNKLRKSGWWISVNYGGNIVLFYRRTGNIDRWFPGPCNYLPSCGCDSGAPLEWSPTHSSRSSAGGEGRGEFEKPRRRRRVGGFCCVTDPGRYYTSPAQMAQRDDQRDGADSRKPQPAIKLRATLERDFVLFLGWCCWLCTRLPCGQANVPTGTRG